MPIEKCSMADACPYAKLIDHTVFQQDDIVSKLEALAIDVSAIRESGSVNKAWLGGLMWLIGVVIAAISVFGHFRIPGSKQ